MDCWSVHKSEAFRQFLKGQHEWLHFLYIPAGKIHQLVTNLRIYLLMLDFCSSAMAKYTFTALMQAALARVNHATLGYSGP